MPVEIADVFFLERAGVAQHHRAQVARRVRADHIAAETALGQMRDVAGVVNI